MIVTAPVPVQVKVSVLCINSSGSPEFYNCLVNTTDKGVHNGDHYDTACSMALGEGFEKPMIAFDKTDAAGQELGDVLAWL